MSQRTKAELLLVVTTFIWGSTFVIVKGALADASPFPFIAVRFILAGLLMFGVMARGRLPRQALLPSLLLGILLFTGFAFQTWGLVFTTPSKSAFITGFSVILVPLISLFHGYPMRAANAGGAGLGLLGLYFLVLPSGIGAVNRGDLLTLFGAMAFAVHIVLVGTYTRRFSFLHLAPGQILVVGIIATLAVPFAPSCDSALDRPLGFCHRRDRNFRHRLCLRHPGVGAAVHSAGAYRLDFCPGTRVRRSDFARRDQRTPGGKGAPGFRAHFGGDGYFRGVGRGSAGSRRGVARHAARANQASHRMVKLASWCIL